jgi:Tol biopolymer transport system component
VKLAAATVLAVAAACGGPAIHPEPYGAGLFTTAAWDFFLAFAPDGSRVLFGRADDDFEVFELLETRRDAAGAWSPPERPRFAASWSNADPHFSPDGRRAFFISNRPEPGETAPRATHDIFVAALLPDGEWGDAERLPAPVNDPARDEWSPAVSASGNLYFGGERPGTRGGSDLWVARLEGGAYRAPENLGDAVNSTAHEVEPWIAPDESYLVFSALRRPGGRGGYDLWLSRNLAGRWQPARPLPGVNTAESEWNHSISPDGKWLYFSLNGRTRKGNIYRVPTAALGL